jgi:hypothetical protein
MRSVYEPAPHQQLLGPRDTTLYASATYAFTFFTGGIVSGGRYEYYDSNGMLAERGWYWSMSARTGYELGVSANIIATPGAPVDTDVLDVSGSAELFAGFAVQGSIPVEDILDLDISNATLGGGGGLGARFGASLGGTSTRHYPDRSYRVESYNPERGTAVIRVETTGSRLGERQSCSSDSGGDLTCR